MSQHRFRHHNYDVITGWDRPLQYFFLVVERLSGVEDEYVYSNLNDPSLPLGAMTLTQVTAKLAELAIPLPVTLMDELIYDMRHNIGNRVVDHGQVNYGQI